MIVRYFRHSISTHNELWLSSGGLIDAPLSERGRKLIEDYKKEGIYPKYPGYCYSSMLSRTYETLKIIYPEAMINQTELLNERSFGEMEYMNKEELTHYHETHKDNMWVDLDYRPGGDGESANMIKERVRRQFTQLLDQWFTDHYELVTIGGHGAYLKGMSMAFDIKDMPKPYESILGNGLGVELEITKEEDGYHMAVKDVIGKGGIEGVFNLLEMKKRLDEIPKEKRY